MKTSTFKSILLGAAAVCLVSQSAHAQFTLGGQYMSRAEYRHGFGTLADTSQKASAFISQRSRLSGEFKHEKFRFYASVQDIRTWGSVANSAVDTKGYLSLFEGYGELLCNKKVSVKVGRQVIAYDDDRIFGGLDWAMQGRRHDAAVFKYADSTLQVHVGAAYNQNGEYNKLTQYSVANNYKTFQYAWANKLVGKMNFSFLFLNNGYAYNKLNTTTGLTDSITVFSQTVGLRGEYKSDKMNGLVYGYFQTGKDNANKDLSAYDVCAEFGYKATEDFLVTLGGEMLSGTSQTDTANKINHSFNPFYGTNHRFNGYMDYYYVGNHINSVGLMDIYLRASYTLKKKLLLSLNGHMFSAAADVKDKRITNKIQAMDSRSLGGEVDFTFSYKYSDGVTIQGGYSQYFATTSLKMIKNGQLSPNHNWAYVMLVIRPGKVAWPKIGLKM